jgi:Malate/L-lactate dehydrogenase
MFGTNPIGFGFPAAADSIVFDMATSALTWYGLVLARARGDAIPADVAVDASGEPTTDPAHAMEGALLPFDRGFKGAGLGMAVEILAGPLVGAAFCAIEGEWGNTIIALDPGLLVDGERFKDASAMSGMVPPGAQRTSYRKSLEWPSHRRPTGPPQTAPRSTGLPLHAGAHLDDVPVALHPDLQGGVIEIQRGPMFVTRRQGFKDSPAPAHGVPPGAQR